MYDLEDMTPEEFAMASFFAMEIIDEEDKEEFDDEMDDDLYVDDSDLYGDSNDSWD